MQEPLQEFDFKSSQYERPQCGWECGRARDGNPCTYGPNRKGQCRTVTTCTPERLGDRFVCTRPVTQGGKCKEGPLPDGTCCQPDESCQPRRNLLSRRKQAVIWMSVLALGFCLWTFGSGAPTEAVSPGELTFQHRSSVTDCATCHTAAEGGFMKWVTCAFDSDIAIADSRKCLKCHEELGKDAFAAHGFSRARLVSLMNKADTDGGQEAPLRLRVAKFSKLAATAHFDRPLACATCHHEHRGKNFDLKAMSNDQCSTCHQRQFRDFGHGHPEFTNFPYQRRSRIYFDHTRHMEKYFPESAASAGGNRQSMKFDCATCHAPDKTGRRIVTHSFEQSCVQCHESEIRDRGFRGVAFVQLPTLNVGQLAENNIDIGQWPIAGTGKQIAELPPYMRMLLQSDPEYQAVVAVIGRRDLRGLNPAGAQEEKDAIARLAWSIKRLFYDVQVHGEHALRRRLGPRADAMPDDAAITLKMVTAGRRWFPAIAAEMQARAAKKRKEDPGRPKTKQPSVQVAVKKRPGERDGPGWYVSDRDFSIRYRPRGHADVVLKQLLEASSDSWYRSHRDKRQRSAFDELFLTLANPSASGGAGTGGPVASGRCLSCHSVDVAAVRGVEINWKSAWQEFPHRRLTKFSHAPHIKTLKAGSCAACHQFERNSSDSIYRPEFFVFDTESKSWAVQTECKQPCTSGFEPTSRATCVKCHTGRAVGDNCLKCHNYHGHRLGR